MDKNLFLSNLNLQISDVECDKFVKSHLSIEDYIAKGKSAYITFKDCANSPFFIQEFLNLDDQSNIKKITSLEWDCKGLKTLSPKIGKLEDLQILNLNYNSLTSLPIEIGNLSKLRILSLINNSLTSLPIEIGNLKKLKMLCLMGNNFSESEKQKTRNLLPNCIVQF